MSHTELDERINLKEILDISEDEFKKQISTWIDEHGLSRKLQSKLRADLFEQFNRTQLGRQLNSEHQLAHRIVLSPLILVLNTLVAEFLYIEDCHFTVSVFANEVPYKNTLPNFENTPAHRLFRFSCGELNDIFEALGISKHHEQMVREFYSNVDDISSGQEVLHKSLLYCILKTIILQTRQKNGENGKFKQKSEKSKASTSKARTVSSSSQQSAHPSPSLDKKSTSSEAPRAKSNSLGISSRYFKFLNRYLEILSNRINDMSKTLSEQHHGQRTKRKERNADSSSQEESLRKDLRQIIETINKLTKSQHKSKRFQDVLNGIERLSASVEKCSEKLEDLLAAVDVQLKKSEVAEKKLNSKIDPYGHLDYAGWLNGLKTSENGRKFIDRLEISLQKTLEKERENLEKLYEEKTNNYRMLIRMHYKQKYETIVNRSVEPIEKDYTSPLDKITPDSTEKLLAESLAARALEKEQQVNDIVHSAKQRFKQLEHESEELDQSFQAYLRRQKILKQQMNNDASKIWENYTLSKAALDQIDKNEDKHTIANVNQPKLFEPMKVDHVINSIFYDDVDIEEVLKDLEEIKRLKSPRFNKTEALPKNSLLSFKSQINEFRPIPKRTKNRFEKQKKVENRLKSVEKLIEMPSIILENPILEKPTKTVVMEMASEQQNEEIKSNIQTRSQDKHLKINGTVTISSDESNIIVNEPIELEKLLNSEKNTENEKIAAKTTNVEIHSGALTNGHLIEKYTSDSIQSVKQEDAKEIKKESRPLSPLKENGIIKTESKVGLIEKLPITLEENGSVQATSTTNTNGFVKKLTTFVSIVSESDSAEISEQISIGQQRISKSPEDFWI